MVLGYKVISLGGIFMAFWCVFVALLLPNVPLGAQIFLAVFGGFLLYFSGKLWYKERDVFPQ